MYFDRDIYVVKPIRALKKSFIPIEYMLKNRTFDQKIMSNLGTLG